MKANEDIGLAVKSKLSQLKERPDDIVWTNIEKQLKKKKRRRVLFFWLIGGLIGILTTTLWYTNSLDSQNNIKVTDSELNDLQRTTKSITTVNNNISKTTITDQENNNTSLTHQEEESIKREMLTFKNRSANNDSKNQIKETLNHTKSAMDESFSSEPELLNKVNNTTLKYQLDDITKEEVSKDSTNITETQDKNHPKKEKAKDSIDLDDSSRWSITPHLIGSNYGALNAGASDIFSLNYGIFASYRMTNFTYVRIGVRKLDLQQTINNEINNVDYLEFPLEVKYAPFDNKLNPYFTGGISYFMLQNSNSNNLNSTIYKATFGINLGLGLETRLINRFYLNLESHFNYQLKPFTGPNEIQPYLFSIQTGIEYRF